VANKNLEFKNNYSFSIIAGRSNQLPEQVCLQ
jgi:hypothetical protein